MLRTGSASARLEGSREELFAILADCGRYRSWVPGIDRSQVLTREGDVMIAELRVPGWAERSFNLEVVHCPPSSLAFRQIDSLDRPQISGRVELGAPDPGVGPPSLLVRVELRLETPVLSFASPFRIRAAMRAALDALGTRRRHLAARRRDAGKRKQKLLEVVREASGLRVWYLGETFRMPKVEAGEK